MATKADKLIKKFRFQVFDHLEPYLIPEEIALDYLDEAQKTFCRDVVPIIDAKTPEITEIRLEQGQAEFEYDSRILRIREARLQSTNRILDISTMDEYLGRTYVVDAPYDRASYNTARVLETEGQIQTLLVDYDTNMVRVVPKPNTDDTIFMRVERKSNDVNDCNDPIEVAEDYHRVIIDYMLYLAYSAQDSEIFDMDKADNAERRYEIGAQKARVSHRRRNGRMGQIRYGGL